MQKIKHANWAHPGTSIPMGKACLIQMGTPLLSDQAGMLTDAPKCQTTLSQPIDLQQEHLLVFFLWWKLHEWMELLPWDRFSWCHLRETDWLHLVSGHLPHCKTWAFPSPIRLFSCTTSVTLFLQFTRLRIVSTVKLLVFFCLLIFWKVNSYSYWTVAECFSAFSPQQG